MKRKKAPGSVAACRSMTCLRHPMLTFTRWTLLASAGIGLFAVLVLLLCFWLV